MKLSIIVPAYNEGKTVIQTIEKVLSTHISDSVYVEKEIIVVDDGSTDNTQEVLRKVTIPFLFVSHDKNFGKGRALQTGIEKASGDYIIIQDADLEYNPNQYKKLLEKVRNGNEVVYGIRSYKQGYIHYRFGAYLLSLFINILYGTRLHDIYTCYKLIPTWLLKSINLESNGFEIEAEITAKILNRKIKIIEIPIDYNPRSFTEGKKIRARDGWQGFKTIFKFYRQD